MIAVVATSVATACGRPVARLPSAPPAPLVARTGCGSFEIGRDGSVSVHRSTWAPPWAPGVYRQVARGSPELWMARAPGHEFLVGVREVDDEAPIAVLDRSGRRPPLDLTRALRVLQPRRPSMWQLNADWAPRWR